MEKVENGKLFGSISGVVNGDASVVLGKKGLALYTNGVNQSVDFLYHGKTCFSYFPLCTHGWVVAFWVQPKNSKHSVVMDTRDGTFHGVTIVSIDGHFNALFVTRGKSWVVSAVRPQGWVHVVITWQQCYATKLYFNGAMVDIYTHPYIAPEPIEHFQQLVVGADYLHAVGFHGKLDELRIWDTVMSDGEVSALYAVDAGLN